MRITDSPFKDAKALLVTFDGISAHTSEGGWVDLKFVGDAPMLTCDIKQLEGVDDLLGAGTLAAGHYTQLRLTVSAATIHLDAAPTGPSTACAAPTAWSMGTDKGLPVDVPSGTVKLVHQFTVAASTTTSMLLDFDGDKSVHETGNGRYKLQPVIKVVSVQ